MKIHPLFLPLSLFSALALGALFPYMGTGYYSDDAINSLLVPYLRFQHLTLWEFIGAQNHSWMFESGRLFPLGVTVTYGIWEQIQKISTYRCIQVSLVMANLYLFIAVIRSLGGSLRLALISALSVLALFQLRDYHDPVAGYAFIMQNSFLLGMGAVLLFSRFRRTATAWSYAASLSFYAGALLYYETGLSFFPILLFQALQRPRLKPIPRWGHLAVTGMYFACVGGLRILCLRAGTPLAYNGMRSQIGLKALVTFFRQFSGAFPMIYSLFGRSGFYTFSTLMSREFLTWAALALLLSGTAIFYWVLQSRQPSQDSDGGAPDDRALKMLGWSLLLIPTLLIAISQKYQEGITRPGMAYLPVYLSYFGLALVAGLAVARTRSPRRAALVFGVLLAYTFSTNQIAAARLNETWRYPRQALRTACQSGLFAHLEPGTRVFLAQVWEWELPEYFSEACGETSWTRNLVTTLRSAMREPQAQLYLLDVHSLADDLGRVTLSLIDRAEWGPDGKTPEHIYTSRPMQVVEIRQGIAHTSTVKPPGELDLLKTQ